jgi:hypothetical protein
MFSANAGRGIRVRSTATAKNFNNNDNMSKPRFWIEASL